MADKRRSSAPRKRNAKPNINGNITYPEVRVIGTDGSQLGIMPPRDALVLAQEKDLDLVVISATADPPVCRIMDHGKFKFEQEKKSREAKKKQHKATVKEVKMRYKIGDNDYQTRVRNAVKFLKAGDKVKATINFRGREIQHTNLAEALLRRMHEDLKEFAEVQLGPKREGRNMTMLFSPKKEK